MYMEILINMYMALCTVVILGLLVIFPPVSTEWSFDLACATYFARKVQKAAPLRSIWFKVTRVDLVALWPLPYHFTWVTLRQTCSSY